MDNQPSSDAAKMTADMQRYRGQPPTSAVQMPDQVQTTGVAAVAAGSQLKADMFDYLCWLDGMQSPEELHGVQRLCIASDGTTCWGHTYADAVRVAMEHDKEIFDAMQTQPPIAKLSRGA